MKVGLGVVLLVGGVAAFACMGKSRSTEPQPPPSGTGSPPDGGTPAPDGGTPLAGPPPITGTPSVTPTLDSWQFFGLENGGPTQVNGVTADEGGNIWVAGGQDGLFLLTPDEQAKGPAAKFRRFTLLDGLHPYGNLQDGSDVPEPHYLDAISVSGGPAGTVFVGYRGRTPPGGNPDDDVCENNWDGPNPDPTIYKSGDADRVTLQPDGSLAVVHYDIFSGPGVVAAEPAGRERLCSIYRIQYVKSTNSVWFGGNHGFAVGQADYPGAKAANCFGANYGNPFKCSGVAEHAHPIPCTNIPCTYRYYGLSPDLAGTGIWIGGWLRSAHFEAGTSAEGVPGFWNFEGNQFQPSVQIDVWPDSGGDPINDPNVDAVTGVAAMSDGSAWFASAGHGLAHVGAGVSFVTSGLLGRSVTALARDPRDESVWAGGAAGIDRLGVAQYGLGLFGPDLTSKNISDIQSMGSGATRKMLVGFHTDGKTADAIGVYSRP